MTDLSLSIFEEIRQLPDDQAAQPVAWQELCVPELFSKQAIASPDAIALVYQDDHLTFAEVERRSNRLAHLFQTAGIGLECLVGVALERSPDLLLVLLGIMKAGGAYVPLDPTYPAARLAYMVEDSRIQLVVTREELRGLFPTELPAILLDQLHVSMEGTSSSLLSPEVRAENLAYVIYTSGSTGRPKGVQVIHRGLRNLVRAQGHAFAVRPDQRVLQFASINFDASVSEVFVSWLAGATLCLGTREQLLPGPPLSKFLREQGINMVTLPPSALALLNTEDVPALETLIVAGEACPIAIARRWARQCRVLNAYGPTEYTVCATTGLFEVASPLLTIGYPLANTRCLVLDDLLREVPAGTAGELYLGGEGLTRGYLGQADLTAERFVPDPRGSQAGARLYRTGDKARVLPDGQLEFLGRVDQQVKIRGYRVEPGESEQALLRQPGIQQAAVILREDQPGNQRLVGYLVATTGFKVWLPGLRTALQQELPDYMLPVAFVMLEALPLLENGKLNRNALPMPDQERPELSTPFFAARSDVEHTLEGIWSSVLGVRRIGMSDNFFELGGHSLRATLIQNQINETWKIDLPLTSLFRLPTIRELACAIEDSLRDGKQFQRVIVRPAPRGNTLPLSFAQERVWFLYQLKPENLAYNAQALIRLRGRLQIAALRQALTEIVRRHEIFRTTFPTIDGQPEQSIHPAWQVPLPVYDLRNLPASEREAAAREKTKAEGRWHFDITQLPLVRWTLCQLQADEYLFCYVEHHLIHDGWSFTVFLRDLRDLYTAFSEQKPSPLPEPELQFADFAYRQRHWLHTDVEAAIRQREYWQMRLADLPEMLQLPYDHPRPPVPSLRGTALRIALPAPLSTQMHALGRQEGVTLFMLMLAAFKTLLYRYSGQGDLPIGSSVANRHWQGTEHLIGMVLNSIVLRTQLAGELSFRELLQRVRTGTSEAYQHQDLPFDKVVEAVHPSRDLSYNPLFQVAFNFHDSPLPELSFPGLTLDIQEAINNGSAKFDLSLTVIPRVEQQARADQECEQRITLIWEYSSDLFEEATIARMAEHFQHLLESIVAGPQQTLAALPILTTAAENELCALSAGKQASWSEAVYYVHEMVSLQATRLPSELAVSDAEHALTYAEVEQRSNQLAHLLQQRGIGADDLVAIALERSVELVIALLGVLKAGGAYVPLDPAYPTERLASMLEDSQASLLITQTSLQDRFAGLTSLLCLDQEWEQLDHKASTPPPSPMHGENLAYVIYTSGSTGKPKGVQISHRALTNFLLTMSQQPGISAQDRLLAVTTFSFDIAGLEILLPLITGAQVILSSREVAADGEQLAELMREREITMMQATPATWQLLLAAGWSGSPGLKILCGGEALPTDLARQLLKRGAEVWNMYGPTETTIWSTIARLSMDMTRISIGRPIANTQAYILDRAGRLVPPGVVGELHLGGDGLARGYRERPDLTAERFLPDPFSSQAGARMYQTGDLAHWLPDGSLECLGRVDHQVKIRGFRIELGEIEHALRNQPGVHASVVTLYEQPPGYQRLVAYLVRANKQAIDFAELRDALKRLLPDYMLPSAFVLLDKLPLLANGKLNRKALPAPDQERPQQTTPFVAARTEIEQKLARIWSDVLGIASVGIQDNFFDLGGHSLLIPQVYSRLRAEGYTDLTMVDLFHYPTIKLLSERLARSEQPATTQTSAPISRARAAMRRDLLNKQAELQRRRRA
ncbi:MAG TPA: amino acid adenylation domain-containing protein [Ktedonobacteraceae bacterium]